MIAPTALDLFTTVVLAEMVRVVRPDGDARAAVQTAIAWQRDPVARRSALSWSALARLVPMTREMTLAWEAIGALLGQAEVPS